MPTISENSAIQSINKQKTGKTETELHPGKEYVDEPQRANTLRNTHEEAQRRDNSQRSFGLRS